MTPLPSVPAGNNPCVDLDARFGRRYHLGREAEGVTWTSTPEAERIWLLEIPCKYGTVYPHGGEILAAVVRGGRIQSKVLAVPGILSRRGDLELVVTFHVDHADAVLAILRPRRRPQRSPEDRARRVAQMQRIHQERRKPSIEVPQTDPRIDAAPSVGTSGQPRAVRP